MKREILKEEVDQILNQSFWKLGGVKLTESTEAAPAEEVEAQEAQAEESEEVEQVTEETHTCPLCESELAEDISDEKLTEHIEMMLGIINEMSDITDEELEAIEEEVNEEEDDSEVVEEAKGEMPAFLKKKMNKKSKEGEEAKKPFGK
jgi:DNA repair exonuclease SbcCD ATPase subunit